MIGSTRTPRSRFPTEMTAQRTFVTGTDTGVGKTVLTGLLVYHLRRKGIRAGAIKPFCSGSSADVELLAAAQEGALSKAEINPFYFDQPVAPYAALLRGTRRISLRQTLAKIETIEGRFEKLLIEGAGGVLTPLGNRFTVATLIAALNCPVILVARNALGTINHTLLSIQALRSAGARKITIVLMGQRRPDASAPSNATILRHFLGQTPLAEFPYLGPDAGKCRGLKANYKTAKATLASLL
jgi:dethiobiotin synthetase